MLGRSHSLLHDSSESNGGVSGRIRRIKITASSLVPFALLCGKLGLNFTVEPVVNHSTYRYLEKIRWELLRRWRSVKEPNWFAGVAQATARRGKRLCRVIPAAFTTLLIGLPPGLTQPKILRRKFSLGFTVLWISMTPSRVIYRTG